MAEYFQLAHNERDPKTRKPVARIIHSFGRASEVDRDQLVRLCNSIARVCGLQLIDSSKKSTVKPAMPDDMKLIGSRQLGCVLVVESIWNKIGIGQTFREICKQTGVNVLYERALLAMTANRLCEPESKLGVWDRWLKKVYLPSCDGLKLDQMYEAMDLLSANAKKVEEDVFFHTANLFNLKVDLIFYDTTTASFSIDYEDDDGFRARGFSKEGAWAVQVVVALAVTNEGFPVRCWVLPGNTADVATVEKVRADLRDWNLGRALFVADSGANSKFNREELARACGKYLLATRMASVAEVKRDVLAKKGRFTAISDNLKAKEVIIGDGERRRRYILCYNPREAERQRKHRDHIVKLLEEELEKHKDRKATARWAIDLLASKRFKSYLTITKNGKVRIDRGKIRKAQRYDGKWVLETNDDTISVEDAACGYKGLMVIERCFRSLKRTQIRMMPMYHRLQRRIESHVRICVIALLIERIAEVHCKKSWAQIRDALENIQATEFHTPSHRFFRRNELTSQVKEILKAIDICPPKEVLHIEKAPAPPPSA